MFVSLSKTLAKLGGFKLGLGIRITQRNVMWAVWIVLIVCIFQMMWYMLIVCFWLVYIVFYGLWWCIRAPFRRRK